MKVLSYAMSICIALAAVSICEAAPPKLTINVNRNLDTGVSEIKVKKDDPVNLEIGSDPDATIALFCVPPISYDSTSNGRRVIFFAKKSCVFLVAAFNGTEVAKAKFTITVEGEGPDPKPPTPPDPVVPVPTSKVGKGAYTAGMQSKSATKLDDCKGMISALQKFRPSVAATNLDVKQIVAGAMTAMIGELGADAKKAWQVPLVTYLAVPLSTEVTDKASGLKAIDDMIAGFKAVTK